MIQAVSYFILLSISFFKRKSYILYFVCIVFLWLIASFTTGNADEQIYQSRYDEYQLWEDNTEYLYMALIKTCNALGLTYQAFKCVSAFIVLTLISCTILRFAACPILTLLLYAVYPFPIDVAQMRNCLATSVFIFGMGFLLDDVQNGDNQGRFLTKNDILYCLCIFIATMVHTAAFFWIIILVAKKLNTKWAAIFTFVFCLLFSAIMTPRFISGLSGLFGSNDRINAYTTAAYDLTRDLHLPLALLRVAIFFITSLAVLLITNLSSMKMTGVQKKEYIFYFKITILTLCILPITINYTPEIYRMQTVLSLIFYMIILNIISGETINSTNDAILRFIIPLLLLVFGVVNAFLLYIFGDNLETVFIPIFENNTFFNSIV